MRLFAIPKFGVMVNDPCTTPASMTSTALQPLLQRSFRCRRQFGRAILCNLAGRMQPVQMRNMPVPWFFFTILLTPLQDSAIRSDPCRYQPLAGILNLSVKFVFYTQNFCSFIALCKQVPQYLIVHCHTNGICPLLTVWKNKRVLWRYTWTGA